MIFISLIVSQLRDKKIMGKNPTGKYYHQNLSALYVLKWQKLSEIGKCVGIQANIQYIFSFSDTLVVLIVATAFIETSYGALSIRPCQDDADLGKISPGEVREKCEMTCDWNGECTEEITTQNCGCDGQAQFTYTTYNYEVCPTILNSF